MDQAMRNRYQNLILGLIILLSSSFWIVSITQARPNSYTDNHSGDCLDCHSQENFFAQFENGEKISLTHTKDHNQNSVHGEAEIYCENCHTEQVNQIHPNQEIVKFEGKTFDLPYKDKREMSISLNQICTNCHEDEAQKTGDSTHQIVFNQGNRLAPLCVDCHNSHFVEKPNQPRSKISTICAPCHKSVFTTYEGSVHGAALIGEGNMDVPSCVDCHGVHNISGPYDLTFRNASIMMCTTCHADENLMSSYGISTLVADTYLNDFHGRSANLFILGNNNRPTDKAVCYDCHGIHNILAPDNPSSQVYPENLLGTCQKCHTQADIKFPNAWLGHYVPTLEDNPILYTIDWIFPIIISILLTVSILYILIDARKRYVSRNEIKNPTDQKHNQMGNELKPSYTIGEIKKAKALARRMYQLPNGNRIFLRFPKTQRIEHQILIISFFTLSLTGLVQRYSHLIFVAFIINQLMGGINFVQFIHHIAAVVFTIQSLYHFSKVIKLLIIDRELGHMWPNKKDLANLRDIILFNLGRIKNKPKFDRFSVEEKIEYWAIIWLNFIMILTGIIQSFPIFFSNLFPGKIIPISRAIHSWEAVLAVLVGLIWHTYHVLVKEKNNSIFSGHLTEEQMLENHPLELERILEAVELIKEIAKK